MENKEIAMPPLPEEELIEQAAPEEAVQQKTEEVVEQEVKDNSKESNFRALREKQEQLEKAHKEALEKLKKYETKQPEDEDLEINIGDDDLFEGKHYRKLQKQLKKQEETLKNYENQVKLTTTETKLKTQYTDFDKVVSEENIRKLRETEPEIAQAISSTSDIYSKAVSAYKMIKKLGIYVEDNFQEDRNLAQKNAMKPKSVASVSPQQAESPLTRANAFANGLTSELKRELWREMNESSKKF